MNRPKGYNEITLGGEALSPGGHRCAIRQVTETKSQAGNDMLIIEFDTHQTDTQPSYYGSRYLEDQRSGKAEDDLKWRGRSWLVVDENTEYGSKNLKAFNTAMLDSNPDLGVTTPEGGRDVVWGPGYAAQFAGKLVGIVFRQEEYTKDDGSLGVATKPMRYCDFNKAFEQKIPDRKRLDTRPAQNPSMPPQEWTRQSGTQWPVDSRGYAILPGQPGYQQAMQQQFPQYQQQSFQYQQPQQPPMAQATNEGFMRIPPDALEDEGLPFN